MCGIAGIFNLNGEPVSPVLLRGMTEAIKHRGPDSEGFYVDSFIGLGHCRLAIIDLSRAGHQPMITENKPAPEYAANAPLYNYLGSYQVYVDGGASDVVNGLGLPGKIHVSYLLTFERAD